MQRILLRFFKVGDKRTIKAKKNILFMLLTRGINILVSLLYVPLLINTLDTFNYGIWLTITSFIAWIDLFDIGLGNGLRNKLSISLAENDVEKSRIYISTSYVAIGFICLILTVTFLILSSFVSWNNILNVPSHLLSDLNILVNIVVLLFFVQFFFKIITSILYAFQTPAISSLILMLGQLTSFLLVLLAVLFTNKNSLLELGVLISISPVLVFFISTIILFNTKLKGYKPELKYVKVTYIKDILGLGVKFFVLQMITIIFYQTSNIILAHNVGQVGVTEYNIAHKYIGIISMIFTIIVTPFWSATTEAYNKNEFQWINSSAKKLNRIIAILALIGVLLLLFSQSIYRLWLGDSVHVSYPILILMLIYFVFNMLYGAYGYMLNGIGKIRLQLLVTSIMSVFYLPTAYFLSLNLGIEGLLIAMIFVVLVNTIWSRVQFKKITTGRAKGIWNK